MLLELNGKIIYICIAIIYLLKDCQDVHEKSEITKNKPYSHLKYSKIFFSFQTAYMSMDRFTLCKMELTASCG